MTYLTVSHENFQQDDMKIMDFYGVSHKLGWSTVVMILVAAWLSAVLSFILDILYYKLHPSAVDLSLKKKTSVYIFGVRRRVPFL